MLPAQKKKRVIDSDESDEDGFEIQYESVAGEDGGRESGSIAGGSDINHNADSDGDGPKKNIKLSKSVRLTL